MRDAIPLLETLTNIPSGTGDAAGIDRCGDVADRWLAPLGFDVLRVPGEAADPLLVATRACGRQGARRGLLVSHLDTVIADPEWLFSTDGDLGRGPGIADPLGGVVVMLKALDLLHGDGRLDEADWTVVLNGDEEIGSTHSAPELQRLAGRVDAGFVFESARATGALVRARSGSCVWHVDVAGRSAHAGVNPADGASAVLALAHLVIAWEALSDHAIGASVNVGVVDGGLKRNQVPGTARAELDCRFREAADGARLADSIWAACDSIAERVPGTSATAVMTGGRPAWSGGAGTDALLAHWEAAAVELGMELPAAVRTGGGSDANVLAEVGLDCLDGLGAVGGGYHTRDEWVLLPSLEERARLVASGLSRWARDQA